MTDNIKKIFRRDSIFIIAAIMFAAAFFKVGIFIDDKATMDSAAGLSLPGVLERAVQDYSGWSSRILINGIIWLLFRYAPRLIPVILGLAMFILLRSLRTLFCSGYDIYKDAMIAGIAFTIPFVQLGEAGWYITMLTYFLPGALAMAGLIPLKKCLHDEKLTKGQLTLYISAIILASNFELSMAMLLGTYAVFTVYFIITKKIKPYVIAGLLIVIVSAAIILISPGNAIREADGMGRWFTDYKMLSVIDRFDLGLTSTFNRLVFSGLLIWIIPNIIVLILVWRKGATVLMRAASLLPTGVSAFIILKNTVNEDSYTYKLISRVSEVTEPVERTGLINAATSWQITELCQLVLLSIVITAFMLGAVYVIDDKKKCLLPTISFVFAAAGRVMLGFSPTVWASGRRTFSIMYITICGITAAVIDKAFSEKGNDRLRKILTSGMSLIFVICYMMLLADTDRYYLR